MTRRWGGKGLQYIWKKKGVFGNFGAKLGGEAWLAAHMYTRRCVCEDGWRKTEKEFCTYCFSVYLWEIPIFFTKAFHFFGGGAGKFLSCPAYYTYTHTYGQ